MTDFTVVYIQLTASQVGAKYLQGGLIVMSESLEELKAIIDNAPEGATHIDEDGDYCKGESHYFSSGSKRWDNMDFPVAMRSLSDIKRIIELMEWQESAFKAHPNIDIDMENL